MMRLVTTTALALALTAPGYAVLAQDKSADATSGDDSSGGVYMAKADKSDVFASDFIGKDIYVKESAKDEARAAASDEMKEAKSELAEGKEDASEEMADAKGQDAEEQADARQQATEDMSEAKKEAREDVAEGQDEAAQALAEGPEWESIGEVSDVMMTREGEVKAVLVDVGGFLGMGEKTVAISMDELSWQTEKDDDDTFLVLKADRAALENAPEFDRESQVEQVGTEAKQAMNSAANETEETLNEAGAAIESAADKTGAAIDEAATDTAQAVDNAADEAAQETSEAADKVQGKASRLTKMDAAGYREVDVAGLTVETLEGATVYDMGNEDIGEVVDMVLGNDGDLDEAIIDVGGFLGLGEHRVAVQMSDIKIMQSDDDPDDVRVYVASTKQELEDMPEVNVDE